MKKALIIIGAIFLGLIALAIVGSILPEDPALTVDKDAEIAQPVIEEAPEPAPTLDNDEQRVYDFIAENYPKIDKLFNETLITVDIADGDSETALLDLVDDASTYVELAKGWEELDWAGGKVRTLETAFGQYMVGTRRFYKNWLNGTVGGGDTTQCAKNAVKAQLLAEEWAPRVEERLEHIDNTY